MQTKPLRHTRPQNTRTVLTAWLLYDRVRCGRETYGARVEFHPTPTVLNVVEYRVRFDFGLGPKEWRIKARSPGHAAHQVERGTEHPRTVVAGDTLKVYDFHLKRWAKFQVRGDGRQPVRII